MTEERLKMINKIDEEMKFISEVVNKIEEGFLRKSLEDYRKEFEKL